MKDDFIYDERTIDAEIEALENEQYDLGEGFETDEMILVYAKVGWFHYECAGLTVEKIPIGKWICEACKDESGLLISLYGCAYKLNSSNFK